MSKIIETQATDDMARYRTAELKADFCKLKENDFESEEAYKSALISQYISLRQKEYEYVVRNEAIKAYIVASEANRACGKKIENETEGVWSGYEQYPLSADTCYAKVPELVKIGDTPREGFSCAISANSLVMKISDEMGYTGQDNLIVPKSRVIRDEKGKMLGVSDENNLSAASYIHLQDSIPSECRVSYSNQAKKPTLTSAIKQGMVGIGDEISIVTGTAQNNTTTGCHAMVIVDVQKNEKGEVINYTLQANNPPSLTTIDAGKTSYYGEKELYCAVKASQWMQDKTNQEVSMDMSVQELEAKVAGTKSKVGHLVNELHDTEKHYVTEKHYNDIRPIGISEGFGERYNEDLNLADIKYREIMRNRRNNMMEEAREQIMQDFRNQIGELSENKNNFDSARIEMQACRLEKRLKERGKEPLIDKDREAENKFEARLKSRKNRASKPKNIDVSMELAKNVLQTMR